LVKKLFLTLLLIFTLTQIAYSFEAGKGYIRGFIIDSLSGEPISYATIVVKGTNKGSTSDGRGYFLVAGIPVGNQSAIVSCVGYNTRTFKIFIKENEITELEIKLVPASIRLQELSIFGERYDRENAADLGLEKITPQQMEMMPVGIENDIFKYLQTTTGVRSTGDVTSKYYVRGGGGDQNLVLLNGATVYSPFHALGIFSVVDPEMISIMEFNKGGFAPIFGGRLSSVLNIITKDGNKNEFHGSANASFLSGKLAVEGPIPNGSFIVTGRKSWYSKMLKKYLNSKEAPISFYDFSFKVNYTNPSIDKNSKFVIHGFMSEDVLENENPLKEDYSIKNIVGGLNWHKVWSSPLFSVVNLSYSGFEAELYPNYSQSKPRFNRVIDISNDWDFTYMYHSGDEIAFGVQNKYLNTKLELLNLYGQKSSFNAERFDLSFYFTYKLFRYEHIGLDIGIRSKLLAVSKLRPFLFEPRINFTYKPNPTIAFKAALGRYSQEIVTLSDENELISVFEPWVIIPDNISASEATHLQAGIKIFLSETFTMEMEGYYKYITNLIDINTEKYSSLQKDFRNVNGKSYGVEYLAELQDKDLYTKLSYSLGWAFKLIDGKVLYPRYDSRHSLNIIVAYNLGYGWKVNSSWTFSTGMPFTPIAGFYDRIDISDPWNGGSIFGPYESVTYWGERNSKRLPVYHRLDFGVNNKFKIFNADVNLGANIINVYNQKNIFYFNRDTGEKVYMLTFFPSLSLKVDL